MHAGASSKMPPALFQPFLLQGYCPLIHQCISLQPTSIHSVVLRFHADAKSRRGFLFRMTLTKGMFDHYALDGVEVHVFLKTNGPFMLVVCALHMGG
jgi:hypothetical protein